MHELTLHDESAFITLTYDQVNLPGDGGLRPAEHQKFMKRLRRRFPEKRIKFLHCGEYGGRYRRPHYHTILFGVGFDDRYFFKEKNGNQLFRSPTLEALWPVGQSLIGAVTFESAAYVARYCVSKRGDVVPAGNDFYGERGYEHIDLETGEIVPIKPEYTTRSNRKALGRGWYERFAEDTYYSDSVVARGQEMKPPKYYDRLFTEDYPEAMYEIKRERRVAAGRLKVKRENTRERLAVRRQVKEAQLSQLNREVE